MCHRVTLSNATDFLFAMGVADDQGTNMKSRASQCKLVPACMSLPTDAALPQSLSHELRLRLPGAWLAYILMALCVNGELAETKGNRLWNWTATK